MALTEYGYAVRVSFDAETPDVPGHLAALDAVADGTDDFATRALRPGIDGVALSPLMTWWALLFGLSMLARYEPDSWSIALDLDHSQLAVP